MKSLKFDHQFDKLFNQETCILVFVKEVSKAKLLPAVIDMETSYYVEEMEKIIDPAGTANEIEVPHNVKKSSKLPNGSLVVLMFWGNLNVSFNKMISFKDSTRNSWEKRIGEEFKIVVTEEETELKLTSTNPQSLDKIF